MKRLTVLIGACLAALLVQSALAQQPPASSSAMTQQPAVTSPAATPSGSASDVKEACADDFKKFCPDTQPGKAMKKCMKKHSKELSTGCKDAMKAAHKGHHHAPSQEPAPAPKSE